MRDVSIDLATRYRAAIWSKLLAENAADLSDETIDRIIGPCVCGVWLAEAAKMLRDNNLLTLS